MRLSEEGQPAINWLKSSHDQRPKNNLPRLPHGTRVVNQFDLDLVLVWNTVAEQCILKFVLLLFMLRE